jgi:subtilisin family serine protease
MKRESTPSAVLPPLLLMLVLFLAPSPAGARTARVDQRIYAATRDHLMAPVVVALEGRFAERTAPHGARGLGDAESRRAFLSDIKAFHSGSQRRAMGLIRGMEARGLVTDVRPLWIANVIALRASSEAVAALSELDEVETIHLDVPQQVLAPTGVSAASAAEDIAWGVTAIGADRVWSELGITGQGVLIAMLDTGIDYTHTDLSGRMWTNPGEIPSNGVDDDGNGFVDDYYGYDFAAGDPDPMDDNGHGTITAGIAAGDGTAGTITGVAPGAALMACKVLTNGIGNESSSWEAVQYAVENGADVINMSIGWIHCYHFPSRSVWRSVVENAISAGVVVCAAAGNEGNDEGQVFYCAPPYNVRAPGDVPGVITAGAVKSTLVVPPFSSRGPVTWQDEPPYNDYPYPPGLTKPDLAAPGVKVNSTILGGGYSGNYYSGTSTASPYVAGAAALMLGKSPSAPPQMIKQYMTDNVVPMNYDANVAGSGRLDAYEAVIALPVDVDDTAPGTITDLHGLPGPGVDEVTLQWTAPGDDGETGTASSYELRYTGIDAGPIADETAWEGATQVAAAPAPSPAGSIETMTVGDLAPGSYYFAVRARDDFLNLSEISNCACSSTGGVDLYPVSQTTGMGAVVAGGLDELQQSDDGYMILDEAVLEDGPKPKRHDELVHTWSFNVPDGASDLSLHAEAHHSFTLDYEDFTFSYSTDGVSFTDALTITKTEDDDQSQTASLPDGVSGTVWIRVTDTDRSKGNTRLNRLYVDLLLLRACGPADANPPDFAGLQSAVDTGAGGSVELAWLEASDPEGSLPITYAVYHALQPGAQDYGHPACVTSATSHTVTGLDDGAEYYFVVRARDAYGNEDVNTVEIAATPTTVSPCAVAVSAIDLKLGEVNARWRAGACVAVRDADGAPAPAVVVDATWYLNGAFLCAAAAISAGDGRANLHSAAVEASEGDIFRCVVEGLSAGGCEYDPSANAQTEASMIVESAIVCQDESLSPNGPGSPAILMAPRTVGSESFSFALKLSTELDISAGIYDASGRMIRQLASGRAGPGPLRLVWDGATASGRRAPTGVYYYSIKAGPLSRRGKLILVR